MNIIDVKSWSEISDTIKKLNINLYNAMNIANTKLKHGYVYEISVPLGVDIMEKGIPIYFQPNYISNAEFRKSGGVFNKETFVNDFSNKRDHPLGIVKGGLVEIYGQNVYQSFEKEKFSYDYPLDIIKKGELIGTFGAIDLIFDSNKYSSYNYSASSGSHSGFGLLPKKIATGRLDYAQKIEDIYNEFSILGPNERFNEDEFFSSFFPKLIKGIGLTVKYRTELILIPDMWIIPASPQYTNLRDIVFNSAWIQSQKTRMYDSDVTKVYNLINFNSNEARKHLYAEMIVYLNGIIEGKRLIMKPVSQNSPFWEIYSILNDRLKVLYDPIIFEYSFLGNNEWGLFPLFNFPTSSVIGKIDNAKQFLLDFEGITNKQLPHLKDYFRFYPESLKLLQEIFSTSENTIYTQFFLTRSVLKVTIS